MKVVWTIAWSAHLHEGKRHGLSGRELRWLCDACASPLLVRAPRMSKWAERSVSRNIGADVIGSRQLKPKPTSAMNLIGTEAGYRGFCMGSDVVSRRKTCLYGHAGAEPTRHGPKGRLLLQASPHRILKPCRSAPPHKPLSEIPTHLVLPLSM
jgi:hypothetical protein